MKVTETRLPGVLLIEPAVHGDERGYLLETYHHGRYAQAGIEDVFVQDNVSFSRRGVLRGLHLQNPRQQAKLASVLMGEVFDVAVDVRVGSPTFGQWVGVELTAEAHNQLYIPRGFAHGFCVLSETALFTYKCSDRYEPEAELVVRWDDPAIGIAWPLESPELNARDAAAPLLSEVERDSLPS